LSLCNESFVAFGEVDFGFEVHEVLAAGHGLCLCEVRTVRDAVNLVLRVLRELHDSHRRFHFHVRCFQLVVNLVHVLFKPANFVALQNVLIKRKNDLGKLVLSLFLESSTENDVRQSAGVRNVHTRSVRDDRQGVVKRGTESRVGSVVVRITVLFRTVDIVDDHSLLCQHVSSTQGITTIWISIRIRVHVAAYSMGDLVADVNDDFHGSVVPGEPRRLCERGGERLRWVSSTTRLEGTDVGLN